MILYGLCSALHAEPNEIQDRKGRVLGKDSEGCTWVEGESSVAVGEQDTRHQVRAAAVEQARAAAVQDFLGVDIQSRFMDFQQEGLRREARLTESLLQTTRSGSILKEKVLSEGYRDAPDCPDCRYAVLLKACVAPRTLESDKGFRVELGLNRARFVHGDAAKLTVFSSRDAWVYLYNVYGLGTEEKTALLVPGKALAEKKLKAGENWEYPDEEARGRGLKEFLAELPEGSEEVSAETLRVVAAKTPLPASIYDPRQGGWLGVLRRLHRSKIEWTDDAEAFTVYRR